MELYKRFRPRTLDDIVGNEEAVSTLRSMLEKNAVPRAILFTGPSGCSKTTCARILRKELKCSLSDFTEINIASSRGIDTIREIEQSMRLSPLSGKCRIWLLDEVHSLNGFGQQAALKILEDTPKHVYLFLATTDPGKLIPTLRNRCTEIRVKPLTDEQQKTLLLRVAKAEDIKLGKDVLEGIIDAVEGSARKALVLLDNIQHLPPENQLKALEGLKDDTKKEVLDLCRLLMNPQSQWSQVGKVLSGLKGEEPETIRHKVLGYAQAVLLKSKNNRAASIIENFQDHFFDSKHPGLVLACYSVFFGT